MSRTIVLVLACLALALLVGLVLTRRAPPEPVPLPGPVDPSADVVFVGDSITAGWADVGVAEWPRFGDAQNLGVCGSRVVDVRRVVELMTGSPRLLVIAVGTNDLPHRVPAGDIAAAIVDVVAVAHRRMPATEILVVGILPRARQRYDVEGRAVNAILRTSDMDATFVELELPVTPDVLPDSLHPSALGYRLLADQLVPVITSW